LKKRKIIFVVPDGTGIRNYLFSQIIPNLIHQSELLIYHALSEEAIEEVEQHHDIKLSKKVIPRYKETITQKFFREAICYGRLIYNSKLENNPFVLANWKTNFKGIKKVFYKIVEFFGSYLSKDYQRILLFEKKYQKALLQSIDNEIEFLKTYEPDVIFCTHQRALNAIPIFKAAEKLGIKSVGAIYSWDNLVKSRLAVRTKTYIVWSNYMQNELLRYYPEISKENITITGTPQFELYNDIKMLSKKEFFDEFGLDTNKKTICFSGDDELTSPYDPQYLEDLAETIIMNNYQDKIQVVFRRSPVDVSGRYNKVLKKYNNILISIEPKWSNTQKYWTQLFPYYDDVKLLANICKHCDLVINVGSSMAHDFAVFNNPAAYINYDTVLDRNWSVKTIYNFQHFKSMPNKDVVYWINLKKDFVQVIDKALEFKISLGKDWLKVVNQPNNNSTEKITKFLAK